MAAVDSIGVFFFFFKSVGFLDSHFNDSFGEEKKKRKRKIYILFNKDYEDITLLNPIKASLRFLLTFLFPFQVQQRNKNK